MLEPVQVVAKGWSGPLGYAPKPTQVVTVHVAGPVPSTGQLALTVTTASGEQITALLAGTAAFEVAGALTRTQLPVRGLVAAMAGKLADYLATLPPAEAERRMARAMEIATTAKSRRVPIQSSHAKAVA